MFKRRPRDGKDDRKRMAGYPTITMGISLLSSFPVVRWDVIEPVCLSLGSFSRLLVIEVAVAHRQGTTTAPRLQLAR